MVMLSHRSIWTALQVAALGALALHASAQIVMAQNSAPLVEDVEIVGNRRLAAEELLKHIKTRAGDPYSEAQVQRDLQALVTLGVFYRQQTRVRTEVGQRGGVVVIFEVVE